MNPRSQVVAADTLAVKFHSLSAVRFLIITQNRRKKGVGEGDNFYVQSGQETQRGFQIQKGLLFGGGRQEAEKVGQNLNI